MKQEYNKLLERFHKNTEFFEDKNIKLEIKMQKIKKYKEIIEQLGKLLDEIKDYTEIEAMEGFKEE